MKKAKRKTAAAELEDILRDKLGFGVFFKPRSSHVYKADSVVVVNDDRARAIVVKLADGRVITSKTNCDNVWGWISRQFWAKSHRKALVKLGLISAEDVAAFDEAGEIERQRAAADLRDGLEIAGLKPTKAQEKFITANL